MIRHVQLNPNAGSVGSASPEEVALLRAQATAALDLALAYLTVIVAMLRNAGTDRADWYQTLQTFDRHLEAGCFFVNELDRVVPLPPADTLN